jgi:hypothetical protein
MMVVNMKDEAVAPEKPLAFAKLIHAELIVSEDPSGHHCYRAEMVRLGAAIAKFLDAPVPAPVLSN